MKWTPKWNWKKYTQQLLICLLSASAGLFGGYMAFGGTDPVAAGNPEEGITASVSVSGEEPADADAPPKDAVRITPSTKMVYEYYYEGDGVIETTEEIPPYFLIDMTEQDVENGFTEWDVISFTDAEVVMRKTLAGQSGQYYVIGEHNGFVAVFYQTETNGSYLKEITDTPISALAAEERERLREGVPVFGEDALIRALEDYET